MPRTDQNPYAKWQSRATPDAELRDGGHPPPERLLQAIWQHQRLQRDQLHTLDGAPLRVLHPGFGGGGSGPDFRGAVLQFGTKPPESGDVEVDLRSNGWRAHGHDKNPAFKGVRLHVVWDAEGTTLFPGPTLAIRSFLDAPVGELSLWLERDAIKPLPERLQGKCSAPLRKLPEETVNALLDQAARVRFEAKAAQFAARARQAGWEQALWEGLFRAAGYQHNTWPMQCLAERRHRWAGKKAKPATLHARLFGLSGLLPAELTRREREADAYLRHMWDAWWREQDEFRDIVLPKTVWRLHGLRPANHPQRRLALVAHWIAADTLPAKLEQWCNASGSEASLAESLRRIFHVESDEFWSWHYTLRSARLKKPQPLIGAARVTDLAINVVLPWLWTRANEGKNEKLRAEIERRYFAWPAAEDNAVLRLARQRLLTRAHPGLFRRAAPQQGLLQIVRNFCDHSNAVCAECEFPKLVQGFEGLSRG